MTRERNSISWVFALVGLAWCPGTAASRGTARRAKQLFSADDRGNFDAEQGYPQNQPSQRLLPIVRRYKRTTGKKTYVILPTHRSSSHSANSRSRSNNYSQNSSSAYRSASPSSEYSSHSRSSESVSHGGDAEMVIHRTTYIYPAPSPGTSIVIDGQQIHTSQTVLDPASQSSHLVQSNQAQPAPYAVETNSAQSEPQLLGGARPSHLSARDSTSSAPASEDT